MLEQLLPAIKNKESAINSWLESKRKEVTFEPLYSSVDLRNSGFKIVPVDTNIFPAGWNNLCPNYGRKASDQFRKYFDTYFSGTQCLLIIPEDHTRNLYYFSNLKQLSTILSKAGFEVMIGTFNPEIKEKTVFQTQEGEDLTVYKIEREGDNIFANNKRVCQVVMNNDFAPGIPEILKGIKQNLLPSPKIGWHTRRKSEHFRFYRQLVQEFSQVIEIDSWHFESEFQMIENVNIDDATSREPLALAVEELIAKIAEKYKKHGIQAQPSVFIKNNAGTYGIAVIRVNSGDDVRNLNQKNRKQMRVGKGSVNITSFLLQEGVATIERVNDLVAEPVIYLVGHNAIGGFYRLNEEKGDTDNLNSKGMQFSKSCFHENVDYRNTLYPHLTSKDMAPLDEVIATIASLAAGYEMKELR